MNHLKIFSAVFAVLCCGGSISNAACPTPPTAIDPTISVKSVYDKKTSTYTYTYTVANSNSGRLAITHLNLMVPANTKIVSAPKGWRSSEMPADSQSPAHIQFFTFGKAITPRTSVSGFVISSSLAPGIIQYYAMGEPDELPAAVTVNGDDEVPADCPGFYYGEGSPLNNMPTGQTEGPVSLKQIKLSLLTKLKREKPIKGEDDESDNLQISSTEKGTLQVIAFPTEKTDLTKIDLATIKFGPGNASPTKVNLVTVKGWPFGWRRKPDANQPKFIVMEFNLADLQIRCDVDHALFLNATDGHYPVVGSTRIQPVVCSKDLWRQMGIDRKWPKRPWGD